MQNVIPYSDGNQQRKLGTAEWMHPDQISERYPYNEGTFWLGRNLTDATPIGFNDDRHICLVSGNRGGKGTTTIIPNIALWPGSLVVIDPKGENASVMAARRGKGSKYCEGMGQRVFVLDPFAQATVDDTYRVCYNPLDVVDPDSPEAIDEAGRIADALVVTGEGKDPHWEESARAVIKALILHVVTFPDYEGERSLTTVRKLLMQGDKPMIAAMKKKGIKNIPSAQVVLWDVVRRNQALDGLISSMGENYFDMAKTSPKEYNSVRSVAVRNTEFIDSHGMKKMLSRSDFQLSELKTDKKGVSIFLTLPQRYMNTHFRWLRMMISLVTTEMEKTRQQPATGHRVLMCLDEFAGLRRMEVIENAVAQIAGYGVKLFFVLQSLEQLKAVYPERWQTFLNNTSLKIFYSTDDHFTRDYVSNLLGEQEIIRSVQTQSQADGMQETNTSGTSISNSETATNSRTAGTSTNTAKTKGHGTNESQDSGNTGGSVFNLGGLASDFIATSLGGNIKRHWGSSQQKSNSKSQGTSESATDAYARGKTDTSNESLATGHTQTATSGVNETIQKRALITPDEIGRVFSRQEGKNEALYPGAALVLVSGQNPIILRKTNYFEDTFFCNKFDPHPDHPFIAMSQEEAPNLIEKPTIPEIPVRTLITHKSLPDDAKMIADMAKEIFETNQETKYVATRIIPYGIKDVWRFLTFSEAWESWMEINYGSTTTGLKSEFQPGDRIATVSDNKYRNDKGFAHVIGGANEKEITLRLYDDVNERRFLKIKIASYSRTETKVELTSLYYEEPIQKKWEQVGKVMNLALPFSKGLQKMKKDHADDIKWHRLEFENKTAQDLKKFEHLCYDLANYGQSLNYRVYDGTLCWFIWSYIPGILHIHPDQHGNNQLEVGMVWEPKEKLGFIYNEEKHSSKKEAMEKHYLEENNKYIIREILKNHGDHVDRNDRLFLLERIN